MILVLAFIASLIPTVILFLWLRGQEEMLPGYRETCKKALIAGILCILAVVPMSAALHLLGILTHMKSITPIFFQWYYTFFVLAFAEELMKFLAMRRVTRDRQCSWLEFTIFMAISGIGFEIIEAVPYAIGSGPGPMFMRGFTIMHAAFGFITGYFYGKYRATGKKSHFITGFLISWILHGTYDFCLSEELMDLTKEVSGGIALILAILSVVIIILFIRFIRKARTQEKYTAMLP